MARTVQNNIALAVFLLIGQAIERGELLYNVVTKFHYMAHVPDCAASLNPRILSTYTEESFVGKLASVYAALANGPYFATIQRSALLRYLTAMQLHLSRDLYS